MWCLSRLISIPFLDAHSFSTRFCSHTQPFSRLNLMVRKLSLGRVFSRSRDTDRSPTPPPKSPPLSPISIALPLSKGSKFKEEAVSAIFTTTAPTESIAGSVRSHHTSRLQKRSHRVITATSPTHNMSPHEFSPISSIASSAASFKFLSPLPTVCSPHSSAKSYQAPDLFLDSTTSSWRDFILPSHASR